MKSSNFFSRFFLIAAFCASVIALPARLSAQAPLGDFRQILYLPSKDTLSIYRENGDWRFGGGSGFSTNLYFGDLFQPRSPSAPVDSLNPLINFPTGFGLGAYFSLNGEWVPPEKYWGAGLRVNLFDYRYQVTETEPLRDSLKTSFMTETDLYYVSVSPTARYNLPIPGLHLIGGLDFDFLLSSSTKQWKEFEHSAEIDHKKNITEKPIPYRLGVNLGAGYDIFLVDVNNNSRLFLKPFITIHAGSDVAGYYGSRRHAMFGRAGVTLTWSRDRVDIDTLPFDPSYVPPPIYLADARIEGGAGYPGFDFDRDVIAADLRYVERRKVFAASDFPAPLDPNMPDLPIPPKPRIQIVENQPETFSFRTNTSFALSSSMKDHLDAVAEYLKANPGAIVRIVGHSDNLGSLAENQQRSEQRAQAVVNYLQQQGIPYGKLRPRGDGSRYPVGDNRTAAGRLKNRRVEIVVVQ